MQANHAGPDGRIVRWMDKQADGQTGGEKVPSDLWSRSRFDRWRRGGSGQVGGWMDGWVGGSSVWIRFVCTRTSTVLRRYGMC